MDIIRDKLKTDHPNHYTDLRQVMTDIRLMFKNAFIYNPVRFSLYFHDLCLIKALFKALLIKLKFILKNIYLLGGITSISGSS